MSVRGAVKRVVGKSGMRTLHSLKRAMQDTAILPMPETLPIELFGFAERKPRINMLLPSIRQSHIFGGVSTALDFFEAMAAHYSASRLVLTEYPPRSEDVVRFPRRKLVSRDVDAKQAHQLVVSIGGGKHRLAVGQHDVFIATAWQTAYLAQQIATWQAKYYGQPIKPIIYLIQDFEPAFYPWSSNYLLADYTYQPSGPVVAVFNSRHLQQFFHDRGYRFSQEFAFDPQMNKRLLSVWQDKTRYRPTKQRQLLLYGRPDIARNAFTFALSSLHAWVEAYPEAREWRVLSAGAWHPSIRVSQGVTLESLDKMSLDDYASVLAESAIGLSLMVSPHPSYPPLEMAHFGMLVLTNSYANKDLGSLHENIVSESRHDPRVFGQQLAELCRRFDEAPGAGWAGESGYPQYTSIEHELFPFTRDLISAVSQ